MSIRDVMMIQDSVEKSALPAGAGDFSRTAFEYSPEILPRAAILAETFGSVLAKFIAPIEGIYKYVCFCKGNSPEGVLIEQRGFEFPSTASAYYNSGKNYINLRYNCLTDYYALNVGGNENFTYWGSRVDDYGPYINRKSKIVGNLTSYTEKTFYFSARKGEAIALLAASSFSDATTAKKYSFRNQKITY